MTAQTRQMVQWIVDAEARRDKQGRLKVYALPAGDGGGSYEVAGINNGYHPQAARMIRDMIREGEHQVAEAYAIEYIADYTDVVKRWVTHPALVAFLRDCVWNRGPKGGLRILQLAAGVADDGKHGPLTARAVATLAQSPGDALLMLRKARERYERRIAPPVGQRAKFWKGLVNRWNNALEFARRFL